MSGQLEKGLYDKLAASVANRCYPRIPQSATFPLIRYQRILTTRTVSVDGSEVGVTETGMQVDCMARSYGAAKDLADTVRGILHTYRGQWGPTTSPQTHLIARFVMLETENDMNEIDGDDKVYWVSQRYRIWTNMS